MSSLKLQLPNNYVEIEGNEMEYIDGGSNAVTQWMFSVGTVGTTINLMIGGIAGGGAGLIRKYGLAQAKKIFINSVQRTFIKIGIAMTSKSYAAIAVVANLISDYSDIGGMAARALDARDAAPNNGIVWF
ncbi:hypothetical protein AB2063_003016 [Clostridium botulinum]